MVPMARATRLADYNAQSGKYAVEIRRHITRGEGREGERDAFAAEDLATDSRLHASLASDAA